MSKKEKKEEQIEWMSEEEMDSYEKGFRKQVQARVDAGVWDKGLVEAVLEAAFATWPPGTKRKWRKE